MTKKNDEHLPEVVCPDCGTSLVTRRTTPMERMSARASRKCPVPCGTVFKFILDDAGKPGWKLHVSYPAAFV